MGSHQGDAREKNVAAGVTEARATDSGAFRLPRNQFDGLGPSGGAVALSR